MKDQSKYETVVGLEVHARLLTKSKLFCGDSTAFGDPPNTHVSPITLAHPGSLPKMNKKAIEFAIKMGLACHCEIERSNYFARKNYFYPDLPKGYQVSQHTTPICIGGYVTIQTREGEKKIPLNRIHLEEDAGKSLHDVDPDNTCIDFNRAGTALIEIVSEPAIRSGEEAYAYVTGIRKLVRYLEISDGNMEEGSLRCDVNISVREKGEARLGTKVEVKNLNSIRHVKKAVEYESERLMAILEEGGTIMQQTRSFDAGAGITFAIRDKEDAEDYRYFAEPDLTPFRLQDSFIDAIRQTIPALQEERIKKYTASFHLSEYDAQVLTEEKSFSDYFEKIITALDSFPPPREGVRGRPKDAANWMLGPVKSWLNDNNREIRDFPLAPVQIAGLIKLVGEGKLSFSSAATKIFSQLLHDPSGQPEQIAIDHDLILQSDVTVIEPVINRVLETYADKVAEYKKGKKGLLALFVGEVMKQTGSKADPKITREILMEKLK